MVSTQRHFTRELEKITPTPNKIGIHGKKVGENIEKAFPIEYYDKKIGDYDLMKQINALKGMESSIAAVYPGLSDDDRKAKVKELTNKVNLHVTKADEERVKKARDITQKLHFDRWLHLTFDTDNHPMYKKWFNDMFPEFAREKKAYLLEAMDGYNTLQKIRINGPQTADDFIFLYAYQTDVKFRAKLDQLQHIGKPVKYDKTKIPEEFQLGWFNRKRHEILKPVRDQVVLFDESYAKGFDDLFGGEHNVSVKSAEAVAKEARADPYFFQL